MSDEETLQANNGDDSIDAERHAERPPLPPASFELLVLSLKYQAESCLGIGMFGGGGDDAKPDLVMARHTIDLLGVIHEKTQNNLSLEEKRLLENSLTELRFRFVQAGK